jgi:hypothetical protein
MWINNKNLCSQLLCIHIDKSNWYKQNEFFLFIFHVLYCDGNILLRSNYWMWKLIKRKSVPTGIVCK